MCGISGVINKNFESVAESEIKKINNLIVHRGPDDEGFYFDKHFAFGHRRLSILDLSSDGHQPMHYLNKYVITYNGEVYNYLEIKEELLDKGYEFQSQTDTEVILASYDYWGEECVSHFNGMWAFAIYDKEKNIIFCSRDRFGVKPFYYTDVGGRFVFGSEIKQLLEFYDKRYVNKSILMDYLIIGYEEHTSETFFEGVYKLDGSHNLIYDLSNNKFSTYCYYEVLQKKESKNEIQSIDDYAEALNKSIQIRLRSDVKVGTCLSGGLDSSSIAALASYNYAERCGETFCAIHAKSTSESSDESKFAKEVASYCNLDLQMVEPSLDEFRAVIDEVIYTQEEPFGGPSIFMQYFVMQKAKEINCVVMLDGQGGDETLLGYERYYPAYLMSLGFFNAVRGFFQAVSNSKLSFKALLQYMVYFTVSSIRVRWLFKKNNFYNRSALKLVGLNLLQENARKYLDVFSLQRLEIFRTQMPHLLRYEDKNSMRHSIETRLPFIDYSVVEIALNTPSSFKIKQGWTKYILRKSVEKQLPKSIVWRKNKFGFEAPSERWIKRVESEMKQIISDSEIISNIASNIPFDALTNEQRWKLFNVAKWEKIYSVRWGE